VDVSVIIINYNSSALVRQCINSIITYTRDIAYEIIVVDNASPRDDINELQQEFPLVKWIQLSENIGFGRANNIGISSAEGEYIFLLNPDTILLGNSLYSFYQYMDEPGNSNVGVCGAALVNSKGDPATSYGNFPTFLGNFLSIGFHFLFRKYYAEKLDTGVASVKKSRCEVDYVSGAAFFARKNILNEIGGFDKDFFLYFEETELCWRIRKSGFKIMYLPSVSIVHLEGATTGKPDENELNHFTFYHFYRSKRLFYKKTKHFLAVYFYYAFDLLREINKSLFEKKISEISTKFRLMTKPV